MPLHGVVLLLLIACEPIRPGESVRVHYGESYDRDGWVAAEPGKLRKADIPGEEEALRFLARRGLSFEEIRPLCMPEEGGLPQGRSRLPVARPPTRVDFEWPHPLPLD